jgi:hypothetical protein
LNQGRGRLSLGLLNQQGPFPFIGVDHVLDGSTDKPLKHTQPTGPRQLQLKYV